MVLKYGIRPHLRALYNGTNEELKHYCCLKKKNMLQASGWLEFCKIGLLQTHTIWFKVMQGKKNQTPYNYKSQLRKRHPHTPAQKQVPLLGQRPKWIDNLNRVLKANELRVYLTKKGKLKIKGPALTCLTKSNSRSWQRENQGEPQSTQNSQEKRFHKECTPWRISGSLTPLRCH